MGIVKDSFAASGMLGLPFLWNSDRHTKFLEKKLAVSIVFRGGTLFVEGEKKNVESAIGCFRQIEDIISSGYSIKDAGFEQFIALLHERDNNVKPIIIKNRQIFPKTINQNRYLQEIRKHSVVMGIGPSGTGKTYLTVAMAVESLLSGAVKRIILTRPAVEAGESLGYLPGDLAEKINPYLRPLYDALYDMIGPEKVERYVENGKIEIAPLAYMRGRTLNSAFAILDEAQNSSVTQMKMFLTRLGFGSKMVITGDITQVDLPEPKKSGLLISAEILDGIDKDIKIVRFNNADIVRNPLVSKIINAYEKRKN
ncbi:MAG: PhoH family protein [Epsilonproteobacteria bacterium]|nr:PhoH family protein [Campylobacterota bacterium]